MQEFSRLLEHRVGNFGMGVTKAANADAPAKIEITPPGNVPDITSLAVVECKVEARLRRNNIALIQLPDVTQPVDLDGFHVAGHLHLHGAMRIPSPRDCNERLLVG